MMHDALAKFIRKHVHVSATELQTISHCFKFKTVARSDFLLVLGNTCRFEAFVLSGCFRIFTIDEAGNERTLYFAVKGWWLMDVDSFMHQTPSELNIQALEDSEVLLIDKVDKERLYRELPVVEKLFRIMSQQALIAWQRRLMRNHCLTAKERYQHFTETYPTIANKLTDKKISSYLGITPEFLSKIKKRINEE